MINAKYVDKLDHNIKVFYLATILKGMAITMPHAVLTLIFLAKGISYAQIASIQAFYSIAMVIFEFPSGVLADKYRKKTIFILSNIIMLCSYAIVLIFDSFYMLAFAWFIYGISNAFETGTIDAHIVISIKRTYDADKVHSKLEKFIGTGNSLASIASIVGAGLGFFLYQYISVNIYYAMLILMFMSGLLVLFQYKYVDYKHNQKNIRLSNLVCNTIKELRNSAELRWIIIAFGMLQMYIQIHFQMWQSFFLDLGHSDQIFWGLYLLFQVLTIVVYKIPVLKWFTKYLPIISVLGIVSVIVMYFITNKWAIVLFYCIPVVIVFMFKYFLDLAYNTKVKEDNISALTSLISTIMRGFGAATLLVASVIIKFFTLKILYLIFPIISIGAAALLSRKIIKSVFHNISKVR